MCVPFSRSDQCKYDAAMGTYDLASCLYFYFALLSFFCLLYTNVGFCFINQASICSAGDSAAYQRSSIFGDDVVIVA